MIKQISNSNRFTSPFVAVKAWNLHNVQNEDVVLLEPHSASVVISDTEVSIDYVDYSGTPSLNNDCDIALEQQDADQVIYEEGVSGSGLFIPEVEEQNLGGSYKRLVYSQTQLAFYNLYHNPLQIFGMENIDFPRSKTNRYLAKEFVLFTIPQRVMGDEMVPGSIQMYDNSLDDNVSLHDDTNGNLHAGFDLFSKIQEVRHFENIVLGGSITNGCPSYTPPAPPVAPTGSIVLSVSSGSAVLDWIYTDNGQYGFNVEKSTDGAVYSNLITLATSSVRTYTDGAVSVGNTYWYQVNAYNNIGTSSYSNAASITFTPPDPYDNILYFSGSELTITNPVGGYSRTNSTWKELHGHNCSGLTGLIAGSNQLHTVDIVNCTALKTFDLDINNLNQSAVDTVLSDLVNSGATNGNVAIANRGNSHPSAAGSASAVTLASRGWGVYIRWTPRPDHLICDSGAQYYDPADLDTTTPTGMVNVGQFNNYTECSAISCTSLTHLTCSYNWINKINISGSTSLIGLKCDNNYLATMSLEAPNLTYLDCNSNVYAPSLAFSDAPLLKYLNCSGMTGLTSLDLSGNTALTYMNCDGDSALTSINLNGCTVLISASIANCVSLTSMSVITNTSLGWMDLRFSGLTSLNVSGAISLKKLNFDNNALNQAAVDTVLTDMNALGTKSGSIRMGGTNEAPSITGYNATASMKTRKWTFTVM